jgi:putative transferase (TIGR04331 family)
MSSIDFINKLGPKIQKNSQFLHYPTHYGLNARERFQTILSLHQISSGELSILESVRASRMVITDYNGTTYIETFGLNRPIAVFWDKDLWEMDNRFADIFEGLEMVQLLFYSAEDCAEFVNTNYEYVEKWLYSDIVQNGIQKYLNIFDRVNRNSYSKLATQIRSL